MAKKITMQMLAEKLAVSAGVDKGTAEVFLKAFPEVLLASVAQDRLVELDKFGKFYLVAVADRGSVDVNTGAHIVIPGYDKLTFSVDDSIVGQFNDASPKASDKTTSAPAAKKPKATAKAVKATKPQSEPQLEPQSELQPDIKPEPKATEPIREEIPSPKPLPVLEPAPIDKNTEPNIESLQVQESTELTQGETATTDVGAQKPPHDTRPLTQGATDGTLSKFFKNLPWWGYVTLVAVVFLIALFVVLGISGSEGEDADTQVEPESTEQVEDKSRTETKEPKPIEKQKVHVLKYGESLTTISVQYYGTADSMGAIWRLNKFTDPNNIPLGTPIKLP